MRDRTRYLYLAVIGAVLLGILVGFVWPDVGKELKPLGTGFVALIQMVIGPIIFCTIVLGIGSVRQAAKVGKVGGLALGYFIVMSTVALLIGLLVGNVIDPGSGLHLSDAARQAAEAQAAKGGESSTVDFLLGIIPKTLCPRSPKARCCRRCSWRCWPGSRSRPWAPRASRSCAPSSTSSG